MEPIAIIGIGCRFPAAPNVEAFWQLLRRGINAVRETPPERWDADALFDTRRTARGKMTTRWGGFLEDISRFDAGFFGITPSEAATLDPQQRLLLETAWEAFEDAGQVVNRLSGSRAGIFVGIGPGDYGRLALKDLSLIEPHTNTGNFLSIAANRISYFFDLHGPSMAVDTACSSSLVAVHLACQSISNDECDMALAGGVNVICSPELSIGLSKSGAMSPDGLCRAFDARANGYVRGEGAGLIVLKPLAKALADADYIYAVIRGSAINQNGRTNGLTAPSRKGQEAVLREACRRAGTSPDLIQYIEAHGSGTVLGDLIEAEALGAVYGAARSEGDFCLIGSVKTNIGHLETAAGIAGLIKVALSLKHREIPASLHFKEPNPHINFDDYRLRVQTKLGEWPSRDGHALAAISSFAFGGTNAHMIVEEFPSSGTRDANSIETAAAGRAYLLPLSARSPNALRSLANDYLKLLSDESSDIAASLYDMCYTASVKRSHHDFRLCFIFGTADELKKQIEAHVNACALDSKAVGRKHPNRTSKVAFVFSGQAVSASRLRPQWERVSLLWPKAHECDALFQKHAGQSISKSLATAESSRSKDEGAVARPLLFTLQIAVAELWRLWGILPDAVVGDTFGEIAALHFTGILSLQDAMRIVTGDRSRSNEAVAIDDEAQPMAGKIQIFSPSVRATENGHSRNGPEIDDDVFLRHTMRELATQGYDTFLEVFPTSVSGKLSADLSQSHEIPSEALFLEPLRKLYLLGRDIDWSKLFPQGGCRVNLPLYPWQREHHWLRTRLAQIPE